MFNFIIVSRDTFIIKTEANTVDRETLEKEVVTTVTAVHNFLLVHIAVKSTFA